jgi:N-acetylneuraminate synthase/N,N'-diacetyllegionaminate synthase
VRLFGLNLDHDVAVVAEVGVNHEGDVDVAARLIEAAAEAGAAAVKFQSYTPERFITSADHERFARVKRFGLDEDAHRRLARVAADNGIAFFSSAITEDWVPLIAELGAAIKIASGDLTFEPVITAAARTGKPVILSTGAGSLDEIDRAVGWVKVAVGAAPMAERLALLHCVSAYPTPIEEANLLSIACLKGRYGLVTGWSNHVVGPEACLTAVALGAAIVEVHVTDRKTGRTFRDHALSFEPRDLAELVQAIGRVRASLGTYDKRLTPSELPVRLAIRKGLVAARDLAAGTVLAAGDLMYARPASEFASDEIASLVGKRLLQPLNRGEVLPRAAVDLREAP